MSMYTTIMNLCFKFKPQSTGCSCGIATMSYIQTLYGIPTREEDLYYLLPKTAPYTGLDNTQFKKMAQQLGYTVTIHWTSMKKFKEVVTSMDFKKEVMVPLTWLEGGVGHFVAIAGRPTKKTFRMLDPRRVVVDRPISFDDLVEYVRKEDGGKVEYLILRKR